VGTHPLPMARRRASRDGYRSGISGGSAAFRRGWPGGGAMPRKTNATKVPATVSRRTGVESSTPEASAADHLSSNCPHAAPSAQLAHASTASLLRCMCLLLDTSSSFTALAAIPSGYRGGCPSPRALWHAYPCPIKRGAQRSYRLETGAGTDSSAMMGKSLRARQAP
jgi:hypothetical protein